MRVGDAPPRAHSPRREAGQASVELVGFLPLVAVVAVALLQLLAAGATAELAGHAAEAGAVAMAEGGNPAAAARAAVPGWSRHGMRIRVRGTGVRVHLSPPAPIHAVSDLLGSTAHANAGRPAP